MLKCLQLVLPCPFLAENCLDIHKNTMRGTMKISFAQGKLILVVKTMTLKILKSANKQNKTACVQNRLMINKVCEGGHFMKQLVN